MSSHAVKVERILSVEHHGNADRLDIVTVLGWQCVAGRDTYKVGDLAVYIPIDSLLPQELEDYLFPPDGKIKISKHRIKTIKLRGAYSQGMLLSPQDCMSFLLMRAGKQPDAAGFTYREGQDLTNILGITKYEPPVSVDTSGTPGKQGKPKAGNSHFRKYSSIENAKNFPSYYAPGEEVVITEKIHGTNFRAGYVPYEATTIWKKILKFFRRVPEYEFVYGSHNVQMHDRVGGGTTWDQKNGKTASNVYKEAVDKYNLKELLEDGEVIYGEVYGDGIQKGYTYGCKPGEHKLVLFDLMVEGEYQSQERLEGLCDDTKIPHAPVVYQGPFKWEDVRALTVGASIMVPAQKIREGVVVKAATGQRKVLKFISDEYLSKDQTDFH